MVAVACMALTPMTHAGTMTMEEYDYWHQKRADNGKYDSVGMIHIRQGFARGSGSGVYIGNGWVLTVAHVVVGADNLKFELNGVKYSASHWYSHTGYDGTLPGLINGHDIALIKLKKPVKGVTAPTLIGRKYNYAGKQIEIVGYGNSGTGSLGEYIAAGTKRAGPNIIDGNFPNSPHQRVIAYDFDAPGTITKKGPITLEYSGAHGDSGGGLFDKKGNLVALTSFSPGGLPIFGATVGNTNVGAYRYWIKRVMQLDAGLVNSALAFEGNPGTAIPDAFNSINNPYLLTNFYTIPEPASALLLAAGGTFLLTRRRRAA